MPTGIVRAASQPIGKLGGLNLTWDATVQYLMGAVTIHAGSAWQAVEPNLNSEPAGGNANWTEVLAGGVSGNVQGIAWDAATTYATGDLVLDRGGTWQATGASTNSEPISGNADWTLIAGTAYVDVELDPVAQTTEPFSTDGYTLIPAPGADLVLIPDVTVLRVSTGLTPDTALINMFFQYDNPSTGVAFGVGSAIGDGKIQVLLDAEGLLIAQPVDFTVSPFATVTDLTTIVNQPVVISGNGYSSDPAGSRSIRIRQYYRIVSVPTVTATFFAISAVNQGTKTFHGGPDPVGTITAADTVTVVGSTGNNGTYTVASRTATTVVVTQAIPSATGDGWVKKT